MPNLVILNKNRQLEKGQRWHRNIPQKQGKSEHVFEQILVPALAFLEIYYSVSKILQIDNG
jgi:hypothetical protein